MAEIKQYVMDEEEVEQEIIVFVCSECDSDEWVRKNNFVPDKPDNYDSLDFMVEGPDADVEIRKRVSQYSTEHPDFKRKKWDLTGEIMKYLETTDADENPRKSMALYMISSALSNCHSANSKGAIRPNLGFWWSEPSGVGKTPVLVSGIDNFISSVFNGHERFETGTAKGIRKSIARLYNKQDNDIRVPVMVTWDEAQDILSLLKSEALADIYSFFNQLLDNRIQKYTTVARGDEKYPPLYTTLWISGVPEMLEKSDRNFWFDGAGTRFLFVKSKNNIIKPIKRSTESTSGIDKIKQKLAELQKVEYVEYSDPFLDAYNEYRAGILRDITKVQMDVASSQNTDNFPILSRGKYPVLVWKLAIINSASRGNFDGKLLKIELEDLEESIKLIEEYNMNMVDQFNYWQTASAGQLKMKSVESLRYSFEKHIKAILKKPENRWKVEVTKPTNDHDEDIFWAVPDPDGGKLVQKSLLHRYANVLAKDFNDAITTLEEQKFLIARELPYYYRNKYHKAGSLDKKRAIFIKWIEPEDKEKSEEKVV